MLGSYRSKGNFSTGDESLWTEVRASDQHEERVMPETLSRCRRHDVSLGQKIAEGGQAIIYEASLALPYSFKHEPVAVKKFKPLVGISQGHFPRQLWEYKCSHVCKPRGFFFDYDDSLCVVMDRYSCDLRNLIDSEMKGVGPPFPEPVAVCIITQLALGLRGLHDCGIYHRDLKANNILVQKSPNSFLMLGALGMNFAVVIADFEASEDVKGTGFWRAPEVLQSLLDGVPLSGNQWQAADVYSFGMTCFEILTGKTPFDGLPWCNYEEVLSGKRPELPAYVAEPFKDIVKRCWRHNPASRPSFADILLILQDIDNHALTTPGLNIVGRMIRWESSLGTPEAMFLELVRLVGTHTKAHEQDSQRCRDNATWASKFIRTVEHFVSKFGWDSFLKHPSLPFAKHVERRRLLTLITMQLEGYAPMDDIATEMTKDNKVFELMRKVYNAIFQGYWQTRYHSEDDEDLTLEEKLAIVEQDLVEPLMDAKVCRLQIMAVAVLAFEDLLKEGERRVTIERFCLSMQSRLKFGSEQRMACLQETLNEQGWALMMESSYFSSIVSTLSRLVVAYNGRLFADLPSAGFRRSHEYFMVYVGLRFVFQCVSPLLMFKLFGWKACLGWFVGDTILGGISDLKWRFRDLPSSFIDRVRYFHTVYTIWPFVAYWTELGKALDELSSFRG